MIVGPVISRLEDLGKPQLRMVRGALDFAALKAPPADASMPAAFVMPNNTRPGPNQLVGGVRQRLAETVSVVLMVRNLSDHRGGAAAADLADVLIPLVRGLLIGWQPHSSFGAITHAGGRLVGATDGLVSWMEDFTSDHWHRGA